MEVLAARECPLPQRRNADGLKTSSLFFAGLPKERRRTPLTADFDDLESVAVEGGVITVAFSSRRIDRADAFVRLPIVPRGSFDGVDPALLVAAPISRAPIGTGPFRFSRWRAGSSIELLRNPDYWGEPSGVAAAIHRIVRSPERAYAMLQSGKLDIATQLPVATALEVAATSARLYARTYDRPAYFAAVYNTRRSFANSGAKRRALTALLDREGIIDAILAGRASPLAGPYIGDEADPSVQPLPFDRGGENAKKALLRGENAQILYPAGSRTMARVADIWSADARSVLSLKPEPLPFRTVLERSRAGEFDIALLAFTSGLNLDLFTRLHSSQIGGENYGAFAAPEIDRALEAVRAAPTRAVQLAASRSVDRLLSEHQPYAFISTDVRAALIARDVAGLERGDGLSMRFLNRWRVAEANDE